jgi:hypothetical protein
MARYLVVDRNALERSIPIISRQVVDELKTIASIARESAAGSTGADRVAELDMRRFRPRTIPHGLPTVGQRRVRGTLDLRTPRGLAASVVPTGAARVCPGSKCPVRPVTDTGFARDLRRQRKIVGLPQSRWE